MEGLKKLKSGDFNVLSQEGLYDGSVLITLSSRKYKRVYVFRVRNLYKRNEEVLDVNTGEPIVQKDVR